MKVEGALFPERQHPPWPSFPSSQQEHPSGVRLLQQPPQPHPFSAPGSPQSIVEVFAVPFVMLAAVVVVLVVVVVVGSGSGVLAIVVSREGESVVISGTVSVLMVAVAVVLAVLVVAMVVVTVSVLAVTAVAIPQLFPVKSLIHLQEQPPVVPTADPPFAHGAPLAPAVQALAVSQSTPFQPRSQLQE
jgi:hypothetical protein